MRHVPDRRVGRRAGARASPGAWGPVILAAWTATCVAPGPLGAQRVEREVAYGAHPLQRLDLSTPGGARFATLIFVHGGSLTGGDKADSDYARVCEPFVAAAMGCASVNHRLGPASPWPAQAEDVASAVAWVRDSIGARGGDPGALFLAGHSSGATLAAVVGSDPAWLARHGLDASALRGVIPMGSIMWDDDLEQAIARVGEERVRARFEADPDNAMFASMAAYRDHWPIRHVRAGLPPFLFLIAETEQEHPPVLATNRRFVEEARALGNRAEYRVLPDRDHYGAVRKLHEPGDPVFALVIGFVRRCLASPPPGSAER